MQIADRNTVVGQWQVYIHSDIVKKQHVRLGRICKLQVFHHKRSNLDIGFSVMIWFNGWKKLGDSVVTFKYSTL